jgi:plastocyanin
MRKLIVLATVAVATAVIAVPAFAATTTVKIGDIWFISKAKNHGKITVKKGTTVKWTWTGKFPHNVTVQSGPAKFHSKTQMKGSYSEKLTKAGTYKIFCSVHSAKAQSMTVVVK